MTARGAVRLRWAAFLLTLPLGAAAQTAIPPGSAGVPPATMKPTSSAANPAADDPVLRAMLAELERSQQKLQLEEMQRP